VAGPPRFVPVAALADLPAGASRAAWVGDVPVALFNVAGTVYAIDNVCPHAGGPLARGVGSGCALRSGLRRTEDSLIPRDVLAEHRRINRANQSVAVSGLLVSVVASPRRRGVRHAHHEQSDFRGLSATPFVWFDLP